ncbi:MAG: hypothetical protein ACFB0B_09110 [Thermonemataceae bacterium]
MDTKKLIKEIAKLPIQQRIYVIERSMHLMRKQEEAIQMERAVEALLEDYKSDKVLTSFTDLDFERFKG